MSRKTIGILHPGQMGISIAATMKNGGHDVVWASERRSPETKERAQEHGLRDVETLVNLCQQSDIIVSVCPPHAAEALAATVVGHGFTGLYVDANAIAPQKALRMAQVVGVGGGAFVDGSIVGGPAWEPNRTWLYLSGAQAEQAQEIFSAGPLETEVIGEAVGKASALKMCFAANTKGRTALLSAVVAVAQRLDVLDDLERQWSRNGSTEAEKNFNSVRNVTAKAWRFAGEMDEIAATFGDAGLPSGFHEAAGEVYTRMADFKDAPETPELLAVLMALLAEDDDS